MSPSQRMDIRQSQSMVMTPQLQQSIKILQLSAFELTSYVDDLIEQNPFLEKGEEAISEASDKEAEQQEKQALLEERESAVSPLVENSDDGWVDEAVSREVYSDDASYQSEISHHPDDYRLHYHDVGKGGGSFSDSGSDMFENISQEEVTLREHIIQQIPGLFASNQSMIIGLYLVDMLDENGYIDIDFQEVASHFKCQEEEVEAVLECLQQCDPAGVFARSLSECLFLQLKDRNHYDPAIALCLENLSLLAKHEYDKLQRKCGVSREDLLDMCEEIKMLNPKPGGIFVKPATAILQPDMYIYQNPDGSWHVELNQQALPKVLVNRSYHAKVRQSTQAKEERKYFTDNLSDANWLVKALDQRANTILKVATEIVRRQEDFFRFGVKQLKPMVLADIAQAIEMHESTISRVVNGKYMSSPMGLLELKYFFTSHVGGADSSKAEVSSEAVKAIIKELIQNEEPANVLSDDRIVGLLEERSIKVARRTVMKYREALGLPSSFQRKREKGLLI